VVLVGALPDGLRLDAEMYAGCVAGAIQKDVYLELIRINGFEEITVQKIKPIEIPMDILSKYLSPGEMEKMKDDTVGIFSMTVFARKPVAEQNCCTPGSGCC
jgi:arsenite methyltransferase